MFQWKDSFCLSPSNSLKQSNDFELFVSENVAVPPGKKKKKKNQPINLEMDNKFISFFFTNEDEEAKCCPAKRRQHRKRLLK